MSEHKLPWRADELFLVDADGQTIADCEFSMDDAENASRLGLIVRAVNSHDALLAACKKSLAALNLGQYDQRRITEKADAQHMLHAAITLDEKGE